MILSSIGRNDNGISFSCVARFWPASVGLASAFAMYGHTSICSAISKRHRS